MLKENPAPKKKEPYQNNQCRKYPETQVELRHRVERNYMAMKSDCSKINRSCPHAVRKELVVKQEETRDTNTLDWNKIEE